MEVGAWTMKLLPITMLLLIKWHGDSRGWMTLLVNVPGPEWHGKLTLLDTLKNRYNKFEISGTFSLFFGYFFRQACLLRWDLMACFSEDLTMQTRIKGSKRKPWKWSGRYVHALHFMTHNSWLITHNSKVMTHATSLSHDSCLYLTHDSIVMPHN